MVVFADADLKAAAEEAVEMSVYNCGQVKGKERKGGKEERGGEEGCLIIRTYTLFPGLLLSGAYLRRRGSESGI